jgi:hypothetical protein
MPVKGVPVSLTHLHPEASFNNWMRQVTAGLVFDALGPGSCAVDWGSAAVASPSYIPSGSLEIGAEELLQRLEQGQKLRDDASFLEWRIGWSAHPRPYPRDVYRFEFARTMGDIVFHHWFLDQFDVFVLFEAAPAIQEGICKKAECMR